MIQRRRNRKTEVSSLISPVDGFRGSLKKKGIAPKDHIKENSKKVYLAQKEYSMKKQAEIDAKKGITKLKQFKNVESRVYNYAKRPKICYESRPKTAKISKEDNINFVDIQDENINTENIQNNEFAGDSNNIVKRNIMTACKKNEKKESRPQTAMTEYGNETYKSKGKVPSYLVNRKEEWRKEEEEKKNIIERQKIPVGTKLLPEDERLTTLDKLKETKKEIVNTLETLPISMRTMALRNKKTDLENKLKEVEAAIKLFSRENIYVAL